MTDEETKQKININEYPFLIREEGEVFRIVDSVEIKGKDVYFDYDGTLEEGLDMREVATGGLSILIETHDQSQWFHSFINALKGWAIIGNFDYCGYRRIDGDMTQYLLEDGSCIYKKMIPRFFRKIPGQWDIDSGSRKES